MKDNCDWAVGASNQGVSLKLALGIHKSLLQGQLNSGVTFCKLLFADHDASSQACSCWLHLSLNFCPIIIFNDYKVVCFVIMKNSTLFCFQNLWVPNYWLKMYFLQQLSLRSQWIICILLIWISDNKKPGLFVFNLAESCCLNSYPNNKYIIYSVHTLQVQYQIFALLLKPGFIICHMITTYFSVSFKSPVGC